MPIDETGFQIVVFPPRENLNKTKTRRTKTIRITFTSNKFCTKHLFLSFPTCTLININLCTNQSFVYITSKQNIKGYLQLFIFIYNLKWNI